MRENGHKLRQDRLETSRSFFTGTVKQGNSYPGRLYRLHPWRFSKQDWIKP